MGSVTTDPLLTEVVKHESYTLIPGIFPNDLIKSNHFNCITMLAVLEHIPREQQKQLSNHFNKILEPLGRIIITVPSPFVDHILSVRMFPKGAGTESQLLSPVISLTDSKSLVVIFDVLSYDPELYTAKLVHCDADWKKSALKDTDFSLAFNEYNVLEYAYSVNTRVPYIRYSFTLPRVSKSGNYLLKSDSRADSILAAADLNCECWTKIALRLGVLVPCVEPILPPAGT